MGRVKFTRIIILVIVALFLLLTLLAKFITDYYWFGALGFDPMFVKILMSKIQLFLITGVIFFAFITLNIFIATRIAKNKDPLLIKIGIGLAAVIGLIVGLSSAGSWSTILQFIHQIPFNIADPIFGKDVSFYVYTLPYYSFIIKLLMGLVVNTGILIIAYYLWTYGKQKSKTINMDRTEDKFTNMSSFPQFDYKSVLKKRGAVTHIGILLTAYFVLIAIQHYFAKYSIMYSKEGIVVGAGYADVVAYLPVITTMMILAILGAAITVLWIIFAKKLNKIIKRKTIISLVVGYLIIATLGPVAIPGIVQSIVVSPNELNLERPYIEHNIEFTRQAYDLGEVEEVDFEVEQGLSANILSAEKETIDNIRILDWRPLTQTYKQTQEIRLYYDLSGIDIDRYNIDGKYTQVMLAPRGLDQNKITQNAQTWVNLHMVYTHGYGLVMSPVNRVTKQGLPEYFIKDIPPSYTVDEESLRIDTPQIYYGENDNRYVLVNTATEEFDYPKGNSNQYINYDGKGGVQLKSGFVKLLMALRFSDIKILLSSDISSESKIMFTRNIFERISTITPFLAFDSDPYIVIDEGRLKWIVDAYTVTGNYPYSEKVGDINYIRNSVKVVVDAYDGDITYYVTDTTDPLIMTYVNMFPKQFKKFETMPTGLKDHIRYPEDLFKIQSRIYSTYHMDDINVFYNKEDAWDIPQEIYGVGEQRTVEPYYVIMKLPEQEEEEFVLMTSFTPIRKDNMVAWLAARMDGDEYGKLKLYKFPKDKLVYGPLQIEAKIDQDSEISQQLTLWSQQGSRVTRGNLLVIPIQNSILYVEPLYIQAETGQLPQLKRIIVSDGERVVMEETLAEALAVLFGTKKPESSEEETRGVDELISAAQEYYELVDSSLREGNWSGIGTNLDLLGQMLEELQGNTSESS